MAGKSKPKSTAQRSENLGTTKLTAGKDAAGLGLGGFEDADRCDIRIDTDLEGIRLPALSGLAKGDVLQISTEFADRHPIAVAIRSDGMIVGALAAFQNYANFLECLQGGVKYAVTVTQLGSGHCHVIGGRTA
ncbi:hypothetical protein FY140_07050 [Agrobacterium tumefaciens]|uniref:hypothetical protein n=1 Tax=Agrobacterium tumefaciens TaxID=358 RepID=UPI0015722AF5|nr:hypothetical protein [Agrobacterium tumefaciens]UXT20483.1 hypothetical protein FY140_07050 [Agrobacterium tumefaciens]WHO20726.1 hypothetical protein G6L90_11015 [Agrobacterium tumefaciens]WHO23511.1 hypothetical protein G6L90_17735 [Agrobacterium tumefaciens]